MLHDVVLWDDDRSNRALELTPSERPPRAACGGGESGAGAPAVRPQHVEAEREREQEGKRRAVPTAGKRRAVPTAGKEKTVQQQADEQ